MTGARWISLHAEGPGIGRALLAKLRGVSPAIPDGALPQRFLPFNGLLVYASTGTEDRRVLATSTFDVNASNLMWIDDHGEVALLARPVDHQLVLTAHIPSPLASTRSNGVITMELTFDRNFVGPANPGGHVPFQCSFRCDGFSPTVASHAGRITLDEVLESWSGFRKETHAGEFPAVLGPYGSGLGEAAEPMRYRLSFDDVVLPSMEGLPIEPGDTPYALRVLAGAPDWRVPSPAWPAPPTRGAPALWPFGIRPCGPIVPGIDSPVDLGVQERIQHLLTSVREPSWQLEAYWSTSPAAPATTPASATPLAAWNRLATAHRGALEGSRPSAAATTIPELDEAPEQTWTTTYVVTRSTENRFQVDTPRLRLRSFRGTAVTLKTTAMLRGFRPHDGVGLARSFEIKDAPIDHDDPGDARYQISFEIADKQPGATRPEQRRVRIGSLDLQIMERTADNAPIFIGVSADWVDAMPRKVALDVTGMTLNIAQVLPGDQDRTELESLAKLDRACGLVFKPGAPAVATDGDVPYTLEIEEHASAAQDHRLKLMLRRTQSVAVDATSLSLIVLDEAPLSVAQIKAVPGRIVSAVWKSRGLEGTAWSIVDDGGSAELQLPPQVVGEEMLKRYGDPDDPDPDALFHPDSRYPLAFKFSPPARFRVARHRLDTASGEPAWNLRRLFGWAGQTSPGAALERFDVEMLYGLSVSADPVDLRLVELGAAMGEPREATLPADRDEMKFEGDAEFLKIHAKRLALTRTRPSLLYVADAATPFVRTTIDHGLHYRLRSTREVVHPIDPMRTSAVTPTMVYFPRDQGGLAGGVDWGFESLNIYDEVRRTPSTGGRIADAAFTAFGGFASQTAAFANDKSRIHATTELGRVSRYTIERVGRIGNLHHPAKHVIEYERTVDDGKHPIWKQRPILRKVREYVKLDVPTRVYPDGEAPEATRGFVLAAHFASVEIPVNSQWGMDIQGGWIVPLYRPDSSDKPADNHDKPPDIRLQLATAAEPVWGRIANPEDLVFYTTTDERYGSDTSTWPPVPSVDFPTTDLPFVDSAHPAAASDAPQPAPPALHAGYERFTYRLEGLGARVNMLAGRTEGIIEAALENVTLARRAVELTKVIVDDSLGKAETAVDSLGKAETAVDNFEASASQLLGTVTNPAELKQKIDQRLSDAATAFAGATPLLQAWQKRQADLLDRWPAGWDKALRDGLERVDKELAAETRLMQTAIAAELEELRRRLCAVPSVLKELRDRAQRALSEIATFSARLDEFQTEWNGRIRRAKDAAANEVAQKRAIAVAMMGSVDAACTRLRDLGDRIPGIAADELRGVIKDIIDHARSSLPNIAGAVNSEAFVKDLARTMNAGVQRIADRAGQLLAAVPWDPSAAHPLLRDLLNVQKLITDHGAGLAGYLAQQLDASTSPVLRDLRQYAVAQVNSLGAVAAAALGSLDEVTRAKEAAAAFFDLYAAAVAQLNGLPEVLASLRASLTHNVTMLLADRRSEVVRRLDQARAFMPGEVTRLGDRTLRLVRAFGSAPVADSLALTRERLAYVFHEKVNAVTRLASFVGITPSTILMNREGIEIPGLPLRTLGVRLPTFSISDRFIPDLRSSPLLEQIFPDFAGLRLEKLFQGIGFPSLAADGVALKHGVDPKTRTAWASADVLVPIADASVFDVSAFRVRLVNAQFEAHTRVTAELGGGVQRYVDGRITGDWRLEIAGQLVAALNRAELAFDGTGKLRFHVSPQGITVAEALQFLSTLLAYAPSGNGSGLTIAPVFAGGLPVGVRAAINLALPVISSGAFSISNLALAAHFDLHIADGQFVIGAGLSFASEQRPFNLSVLFLGGGGWLETGVTYAPFGGALAARVSIGIAVGASLPFDIGVARGGVSLLLSVNVVWTAPAGRIEIVLAITLRGELVLLGIVSVGVYLRLEARYISGGAGIECSGYMSIKIKIGFFFSISVEHRVTFTLAGNQPSRARALAVGRDAADPATTAAIGYAAAYES